MWSNSGRVGAAPSALFVVVPTMTNTRRPTGTHVRTLLISSPVLVRHVNAREYERSPPSVSGPSDRVVQVPMLVRITPPACWTQNSGETGNGVSRRNTATLSGGVSVGSGEKAERAGISPPG
jgi:hypothetical protein